MTKSTIKKAERMYPRGAEWRQWDLHIHTPASFEWKGGKHFCEMTHPERTASVDQMINTLNQAEPSVFVLMDYWTFDGWVALKARLAEAGAPPLHKTVFPGIELRLVSPTKYRLNAHVIFADDVSDQDLNNFKSKLNVALINQPLAFDRTFAKENKSAVLTDLMRQAVEERRRRRRRARAITALLALRKTGRRVNDKMIRAARVHGRP